MNTHLERIDNMESGMLHVNKEVLKGEINKVSLKPTESVVKGVLPTKEGIRYEVAFDCQLNNQII